jgi:hypothetical protein
MSKIPITKRVMMNEKKQFTPIELLEMTYDKENESLVFKLSNKVNEKWIDKFQNQGKKPGTTHRAKPDLIDVPLFQFNENIAKLPMSMSTYDSLPKKNFASPLSLPDPTLEHIRDTYFKGYLEKANLLYAEMLDEEAQRDLTE